jgi:hypothetical protein
MNLNSSAGDAAVPRDPAATKPRRLFQFSLASLLLLMTIAAVGVGVYLWIAGRPERATLTGLVTYRGQPLPGTITLTSAARPPTHGPFRTTIDPNGRFAFSGDKAIPTGAYTVAIETPPAAPAGPLPAVYNSATVLTIEVVPGVNQFSFDLQ